MPLPPELPDPLVNACPACGQLVDVSELKPFDKIECPDCNAAMRVRAVFDHFRLVEQIGQGGMSRVFRAKDSLLNRDVALKTLSHDFGSDSERIVQFEREARSTASISHPNVVKVFSVGQAQGYFYIAMELVSYSSFEDVISRRGRVSEAEVLNIGIAVTQGLLAAHGVGLIHRDIKPGNILFAEDGTAKLVDFGLALVVERDVDTSNEIWATPYYVAPEKLSGGQEDLRSDIYSLGATLYHALAGVPPVEVSTTSIEELRELKAVEVDISRVAPDVTRPTTDVIHRMLAHEPADRFDSYDQLTKALQAAKLGKRWNDPGTQRYAGPSRGGKLLVAGLVAVALVAVAIILFQNDAPDGNPDIDLVLDGTSSGAGSSASKFLQARELLLSGNYQEAAKLYSEVAESQRSQQPTINWALFNLGVARLLESNQSEAMAAFERIVSNGVYSDRSEDLELVSFFLDLGKLVQSREPVRAEQRLVLGIAGYHCVGLLPLGLRRWELGDVKGGAELLNDFHKAAKSSGVDWVEAYARIVDPYLNDAGLLTSLPTVPEPGSEGEAVALRAFVAAGETIRQAFAAAGGAHVTDLNERLVGAKQRLLAVKSDGAKASAALVSEQLELDREMLQREIDSLMQTRDDLQLKECAEKLQALRPKSEPGARERDAWAAIFRDADRYLAEIGKLQLPTDYRGPVVPREGVPVYGDSFALMNRTVEVRGVAGQPIAAVPFQSCSPAYLVSLGDTILKGVSDSDRFLELAAGMVSLARIFDLQSTVPGYVDLLVASADGEASGGERLRILSRVPISITR